MKRRDNIEEFHLHKQEPFKRQFEMYDLSKYWKENKVHSLKPHSHSFYQIIWFLNDGGCHYVDFESYEIRKNTIFFIAKNQIHYFENIQDYKGILIHFNDFFLYQNEEDIDLFIKYNVFNSLKSPSVNIGDSLAGELNNFIKIFNSELREENSFGNNSILANTLKSFLIRIEREKRLSSKKTNVRSKLQFAKFTKLLEHQYKSNKKVSEYADQLNISAKTLNNIAKTATGKTVSQIIKDRVVIEVKRQLMYSNKFVNEIGFELGFNDPSYFIKFFKKIESITPSQFRELHS